MRKKLRRKSGFWDHPFNPKNQSTIRNFALGSILLGGMLTSNSVYAQSFYPDPITPSELSVYRGDVGDKEASCVRGNRHGGNGVTVGHFNNTTSFGNYNLGAFEIWRTASGDDDIYVLERHTESGLNWLRTIGGPGKDRALSVSSTYEGIVVVGLFSETVDFNPDPIATSNKTAVGGTDVFVLCLDNDGSFNWVYTMGSNGDDWASSVDISFFGDEVFVTGTFENNLFYPVGTTMSGVIPSKGGTDAFVAKFDLATGTVGFVESMGGEYDDEGDNIHATWGDIYLTGTFRGIADVDPGVGELNLVADAVNPDKVAIFNERIDNVGNVIWADKIIGTGNNTRSGAISGCSDDVVYVVGVAEGLTDVDPGPGTYWINSIGGANNVGFLLQKDAATGALLWARTFNSLNDITLTDVYTKYDSSDDVTISGIFNQSVGAQSEAGFFEGLSTPAEGSFLMAYTEAGGIVRSRVVDHSRINSICNWDHACGEWLEFCGNFTNTVNFTDYFAIPEMATNVGDRDAFTATYLGDICPGRSTSKSGEVEILEAETIFKLYPNPANDQLTLTYQGERGMVSISNIMGQVVFSATIQERLELDVSQFESGVYQVTVTDSDQVISEKLIIQ